MKKLEIEHHHSYSLLELQFHQCFDGKRIALRSAYRPLHLHLTQYQTK